MTATPKNSEWEVEFNKVWKKADWLMEKEHPSKSIKSFIRYLLQERSKDTVGEKEMRERLGSWINENGGLYSLGAYLDWSGDYDEAILDGGFSADQLEAIAWWMKNKQKLSEQLNQK